MTAIQPEQGPAASSRRLPWPRRAGDDPGTELRFDQPYTRRSSNPIDRSLDRVIDADLQRRQRIALARLPRPVWTELADPGTVAPFGTVVPGGSLAPGGTVAPGRSLTAGGTVARSGDSTAVGATGAVRTSAPVMAVRGPLLVGYVLAAVGFGAALAWCALLLAGYTPSGAGPGSPAAPPSSVPASVPAIGAPSAAAGSELGWSRSS